jgi:2-oxoisovalerate dehydrogenase E1 component
MSQALSRNPITPLANLAEAGAAALRQFLENPRNVGEIETALRIKAVESALYSLFGQGKLHGTIHTCLGQEFTGVLAAKHMRPEDTVLSNHRCHGHFIAATGNWAGLVDELIGNSDGVCAGIGSSQHLWSRNFLSNGQQGGLMPVAAGMALHKKLSKSTGAAISFIGEGTLGEGIVYETLNIDALWKLPHLVICENNFYSQSTPQEQSVAGQISARAEAFGIRTFEADCWDLSHLDATFAEALANVRLGQPAFVTVRTYRLNPHSKGDDLRDNKELEWFRTRDALNVAQGEYKNWQEVYDGFSTEVEAYVKQALEKPHLGLESYLRDQIPKSDGVSSGRWVASPTDLANERVNLQVNHFYRQWMQQNKDLMILGEDIADPYGGAFKVTRGLPTDFPDRVLTTPISEAAITGIGTGLAASGRRAVVEIMFGDFITYAFDQLVNNASKFFHMYNGQLSCPVIVRAPMGGRRGYGPTHSQSLERFVAGIDNCCVLSLSSVADVALQLAPLINLQCPALVLENKLDYALRTFEPPAGFVVERNDAAFPTIRVRPVQGSADVTLVSYGGMARFVADRLIDIFEHVDLVPELLVLTAIHPLDATAIAQSVSSTGKLAIIEEGSGFASIGAEILAQMYEQVDRRLQVVRISGKPVPVPSVPSLEEAVLPGLDDICEALEGLVGAPQP